MTVEEEFEKWWALNITYSYFSASTKANMKIAYISAVKHTAERCAEICDGPRTLTCFDCAETIKEEFDL